MTSKLYIQHNQVPEVYTAAGTITRTSGCILISGTSATTLHLLAPTVGNNNDVLEFVSTTAQAHVVYGRTPLFNGSAGTATFGAAIGNHFRALANNGTWLFLPGTGVVAS